MQALNFLDPSIIKFTSVEIRNGVTDQSMENGSIIDQKDRKRYKKCYIAKKNMTKTFNRNHGNSWMI